MSSIIIVSLASLFSSPGCWPYIQLDRALYMIQVVQQREKKRMDVWYNYGYGSMHSFSWMSARPFEVKDSVTFSLRWFVCYKKETNLSSTQLILVAGLAGPIVWHSTQEATLILSPASFKKVRVCLKPFNFHLVSRTFLSLYLSTYNPPPKTRFYIYQ